MWPAFAFLVTPKLPLGGRSVKLNKLKKGEFPLTVNSKLAKSFTGIAKTHIQSKIKIMSFPSSIGFVSWKIGALLRITGADAEIFLQGQFTNDLRGLTPGGAVYGLWLNQKGKVLADSFILRGTDEGEFWVVSYFSGADELRRRLEDYIIADDVSIENSTAGWSGVSLVGSGASAWLAAEAREGRVFPGRRTRGENWEWIFPNAALATVRGQLAGGREIGADELERCRIADGIPAVPADIGPGDLPAEGGLDAEGISYTKGCYLGQEVMARLKNLGQVRRRLMRVRGGGTVPAVPGKLTQAGRAVGELRSVIAEGGGFAGLALVSLVNLQKDQPLALDAAATPGAGEIILETS